MSKRLGIGVRFGLTITMLGALLASPPLRAGTWVGNGDDGSDLEGAKPLTEGKILAARGTASQLLKRLSVPGIPGLGALLPEVERSPLYLAQLDSQAKLGSDTPGSAHTDMTGRVYARTLAQPYAPTRFFPVAEKLEESQLVALHVHEALHRTLPPSVREDESTVSELTLAIVSPEATHDGVRQVAHQLLPESDRSIAQAEGGGGASYASAEPSAPETSMAVKPSQVGYEFRNYWNNPDLSTRNTVNRMHLVRSYLHPFGGRQDTVGFGIEAALIQQPARSIMGPLGLSTRIRLWSGRGFDVAIWGAAALNMLSAEELKQSPFGRDVFSAGLQLRKDLRFFYVDNTLAYSLGGDADSKLGNVKYKHSYGGVVQAAVRAGTQVGPVGLGGFVEIFLADHYRVTGGAFEGFDTGRYRLVSAGPEAQLRVGDVIAAVYGKALLSAPADIGYDSLGNLMGPGSGQASLGARVSVCF